MQSSNSGAQETGLRRRPGGLGRFVLASLIWILFSAGAAAQDAAAPASNPQLASIESIQNELDALGAPKPEDSENVKKHRESLQKILDFNNQIKNLRQKTSEYESSVANATNLLAEIKKRQESAAAPAALETDLTSAQLESIVLQTQADLDSAQKRKRDLEAERVRRENRLRQIPQEISKAKEELEMAEAQLQAGVQGDAPPEVKTAANQQLRYQKALLETRIRTLEKELQQLQNPAEKELLQARADQADRQIGALSKQLELQQKRLAELRTQESEEASRKLEEEYEKLVIEFPTLESLSNEAKELLDLEASVFNRSQEALKNASDIAQRNDELSGAYEAITNRVMIVENSGMQIDDSLGQILRKQLEQLPKLPLLTSQLRNLQRDISKAQLDQIETAARNFNITELDILTEQLVRRIVQRNPRLQTDDEETPLQLERIREKTRELLESKRDSLNELDGLYRELVDRLLEAEKELREQDGLTRKFSNFIRQRIFWIRSSKPLAFREIGLELRAVFDLFSNENISNIASAFWRDLSDTNRNPFPLLSGAALALVGFVSRKRLSESLVATGQEASKITGTSIAPTLKALGLSLLIALPGPLLLLVLGWRLKSLTQDDEMLLNLGQAFIFAACIYFTLSLIGSFCLEDGLGSSHFKWRKKNTRRIRRQLAWFAPVWIVLLCFISFRASYYDAAAQGRGLFILAMIALAVLNHRLLKGDDRLRVSAKDTVRIYHSEKFLNFLYAFGMLVAATGILATVVGYYYTTIQLAWRLEASLWLAIGILIVNELLARWLYVARRKLVINQARQKREQQQQESMSAPAESVAGDLSQVAAPVSDEVDIAEIYQQNQRLFQSLALISFVVGLWAIWVEVLPALGVLDKVRLWEIEQKQAVAEASAAPAAAGAGEGGAGGIEGAVAEAENQIQSVIDWITLGDVLFAILILFIAVYASKNIPGLLELTILRHMQLEAGGGYAITTLVRYLITLIGIIVAFNAIGVSWEKVQWLAAAISLGIGFGLQEIVANFVSGLIILFERPIRVGDIVTVGDVSGSVSQIQIRATTIKDWNNKELLVPNKQFITSQVVNWTLTDPVTRVVIPVGVPYSCDLVKAQEILVRVGTEHRLVTKEKKASVYFNSFGDNSINYDLRVFISDLDYIVKVKNEITVRIVEEFRKAGIEIPFPQRDVHIKTLPEGFGR